MKAGWVETTLGEQFDITSSKRVFKAEWTTSGVPFYRAREIVKLAKFGEVDNQLFISEEMFSDYSTKYGAPVLGDIIVTGVGTLGICYLVKDGDRFYFKDGNCIWLKNGNENILPRYVEYAFQSNLLRDQIDNSNGATVGAYTIIKAKQTKIPLPPLEEQKRIVAILDEVFVGLDRARAHTEANLQNARDFLQSGIDKEFERINKQNGSVPVSDLCESIVDCVNRTAPKTDYPTDFIMIRTSNIRYGELNLGKVKYVDEETYNTWTRRQVPQIGDILLTREAPMGEACLVETSEKIFLGQRIVSYRADARKLVPSYLLFAFQSKLLKEQFTSMGSGATVKHIRVPQSKELLIPIVSVELQQEVLKKLSKVRGVSKTIEGKYKSKLTDLDDLRQSLLQKAFAGELT